MSIGAFGENFPYTNFHDLNMDWIIKIAKDFLDQYSHLQETIDTGMTDLQEKADALEQLLQEWYDTHSQDIAVELARAISEFGIEADQKAIDTIATIPNDYTALQKSHDYMNSPNILDSFTKQDRTVSGITFAWSGTECVVTGTSNGSIAFCNIFASENTFPANISAGDIIYAGNLKQSKSKLEIFCYVGGSATLLYNSLATYDVDYIAVPANATGMIIRLTVEQTAGVTVNETVYPFVTKYPTNSILNARTFHTWIGGDVVYLKSTEDTRDRAAEIMYLLYTYKHVVLLKGDFYTDRSIQIPAGTTLEGLGKWSRIVANGSNVTAVTMVNNTKIKNLCIDGGLTATPATEGTRYGIYIDGVTEPFWIEDCVINGFDKYGIYIGGTTGSTVPGFISTVYIYNCFSGLWVTESEYLQFTNLCIRNCYRGCYENGGNNKYTGCAFDSNSVGLQMSTAYTNNGHGTFSNCSFNHNTDYAIFFGNVTNGELFSGCQIHWGVITFNGTTRGVNFSGCQFGQYLTIRTQGDGRNYINDSEFYADPTFSLSGAGILTMHNCYNFVSGEQVTPQ